MDDTSKKSGRNVLQIYCINLKERSDRWQRFFQQPGLQKLIAQYRFERFEGVNGKLLDIKNDERISLRTKRNIMYQKRRDHEDLDTAGGVGCYLSHYGCWKKFLDSGAERCLIFEDDAEVLPDFAETLESALEDLEQEYRTRPDIWLLSRPFGSTLRKALEIQEVQYNGNWAYDVVGPLTGYILTRSGAQALCDNAFPIDGHVDHFMHRCAQMGMVVMAHHKKISLRQHRLSAKDSDIQQKPKCEICDLPDAPQKRGYLILTNQTIGTLAAAGVSLFALLMLRSFSKA
jgi:GR25 family glycosyltransferase involved in LPS biosynthesis